MFIWIYGILYYFINSSKMTYKTKNLLIISCSIILTIYICLISLVLYMVMQIQRMYRDVYNQQVNDPGIVIAFDITTSFEDLPTIIYQSYHKLDNTECWIWMQNFVSGDIIKVLPNCFHYFHFLCIQEWFKRRKWCPLDKKEITKEALEEANKLTEAELIFKISCQC